MPAVEALRLTGICKSFGRLIAVDDVSCTFKAGEIHAVVGENGAGKSTVASIVCGFQTPDRGTATLVGSQDIPVPLGDAAEARRLGIELVHQHFTLVPHFTVAENLALPRIPALTKVLRIGAWAQPAVEAGHRLGWSFDLDRETSTLSVGAQQRLEIVRVLGGDPHVVIFDEPTAVLSPPEVAELTRVLRMLSDQGKIVVLIAHKLSEIMEVADRVTVLRKGKRVAEAARGEFDASALASWMVGELPPFTPRPTDTPQVLGLELTDATVRGARGEVAVHRLSLQCARGEILGVGGVDGNGQYELAEVLVQIRKLESGQMKFEGRSVGKDLLIGYIPQDRRRDGLALELSIQENDLVTGRNRRELKSGAFLGLKKIRAWAESLIQRFEINAGSVNDVVGKLSGGNQQKVVASRTLDRTPDLLVVCSPSRGLDVRATQFIHAQILAAKENDAAVVLISADLDELSKLSDRVVFLSKGRFATGDDAQAVVGGASSVE
jgi:ABC-type uncharacterized transport system ATPase subunit